MIVTVYDQWKMNEEYILPLRCVPTQEAFLGRARVRPDSYSGRLISELFEHLFAHSLELKRDYVTYYQTEYGSFGLYLRKRHLLGAEDAERLEERYSRSAAIIRYNRPYTFMGEGVGAHLLERLLDTED